MKSKVDPAFWRRFNTLPPQIQQLAGHAFTIWLKDPFYPSLHFKKLKGDLWSVRVGEHYRATGYFFLQIPLSGFGLAPTKNTTSSEFGCSGRIILTSP